MGARKLNVRMLVVAQPRELGVVVVDDFFGLATADAQVLRQAESPLPVDDAEVDCFGFAAHFTVDLGNVNAKYFRCCGGVDVDLIVEGLNHAVIIAQRSNYAQLNLTVVGREQKVLAVTGNEGLAHGTSAFGANRNVLKVRIV